MIVQVYRTESPNDKFELEDCKTHELKEMDKLIKYLINHFYSRHEQCNIIINAKIPFQKIPFQDNVPVEAGKEYDVSITEISRRGDGIAKIEGFIIFVSGAKVGQQAKIKIIDVAPRFAKAEIVDGSSSEETSSEETASEE